MTKIVAFLNLVNLFFQEFWTFKVYRMADEMLAKLPDDYVPHQVKARMKAMGELASLNIFLKQEIDRMQRVLIR